MSIYDIPIKRIDGAPADLSPFRGKVILAVNVASKCGFTPQYDALQPLHDRYEERGFAVLGFPCNQFKGQEPGSPEEIEEFCRINYGVSFPLFEKIDVNGDDEHPLFTELKRAPDDEGKTGDVYWNFEKFLISRDGRVVRRFRTLIKPDDPLVVEAIESLLEEQTADAGSPA